MNITAAEQELLLPEIRSFAAALHDESTRDLYLQLHASVEDGVVEEEDTGRLANVLELGLQSGRLRKYYGADGELALADLFKRTPAGSALAEQSKKVTAALKALEGQVIDSIRLSTVGPGSYGLTIGTDRCDISIRMERSGVRVESVALGI